MPDRIDLSPPGSGGIPTYDPGGFYVGDYGGDGGDFFLWLGVMLMLIIIAGFLYLIYLIATYIIYMYEMGKWHLKHDNYAKALAYLILPVGLVVIVIGSCLFLSGFAVYDTLNNKRIMNDEFKLIHVSIIKHGDCKDIDDWRFCLDNEKIGYFSNVAIENRSSHEVKVIEVSTNASCDLNKRIYSRWISPQEVVVFTCWHKDPPEQALSAGIDVSVQLSFRNSWHNRTLHYDYVSISSGGQNSGQE